MKSSLNRILIVFNKEVIDNLRDRRSIFSALATTIIGPALLLLMIIIVGKTLLRDQTENKLQLQVIGAENAPTLIMFLEQRNVEIIPAPADPETAVRNGDSNIILVIPEGYGEDFTQGRPATVKVIMDSSRQSALSDIQRTSELLENYSGMIGSLRLITRSISPTVTDVLAIERVDVSTPQTQVLVFLNMMPYFIIMVVFVGGMYVIIDSTAGERERGSLEPLLINPVARREFVIGKLLASIPFAILSVFVTLAAFALSFNAFPLEEYIGYPMSINLKALVGIFFISLPMIFLASAIQMVITSFTRSFKEAQTYVGFLPLVPALPGIGLAFMPVKAKLWTMLIPTFGQQLLINQMMRGEPISTMNILVSTLVTTLAAIAVIFLAIRLYEQERLLFGSK
jgi:sodium transport system permease protein